jgi:acyl-CoA synthetase (AMP-forming)/AMP-acid ligase II
LQPMMIRRELALCVPSFMLPEHVVILRALPRTASGKPDRQALAAQAAALLTHK